jgi:hypothetical protein
MIALIHYYNGQQITRKNADEIAKKNGFTSDLSGESLYQKYTHYNKTSRRIRKESTAVKRENKIELFESVLPFLNDAGKQKAKAEIQTLKSS